VLYYVYKDKSKGNKIGDVIMYFKNKAQKYGYTFGKICRVLGFISTFISAFFVPNENKVINIGGTLSFIISLSVFWYGYWRTGGWNEE
jgi:hypothetical protein